VEVGSGEAVDEGSQDGAEGEDDDLEGVSVLGCLESGVS